MKHSVINCPFPFMLEYSLDFVHSKSWSSSVEVSGGGRQCNCTSYMYLVILHIDLPLSLAVSHLEQKAAAVLLTLLNLGVKNIRLGPSLPLILQKLKDCLSLFWSVIGRQEIGWKEVSNVLPIKEQKYPTIVLRMLLKGNSFLIPPCVEWLGPLSSPFFNYCLTLGEVLFTMLSIGQRTGKHQLSEYLFNKEKRKCIP